MMFQSWSLRGLFLPVQYQALRSKAEVAACHPEQAIKVLNDLQHLLKAWVQPFLRPAIDPGW